MADNFYSGLVADLYRPLRGGNPDPEPIARFIAKHGEPALELGCGDGDPMLALVQRGIDVDGVDISPDMIERAARRAHEMGMNVNLFVQSMETMELPRKYRSIYLAGGTFTLLADDAAAARALRRIRAHLDAGGCAMVPLFIPNPMPDDALGTWKHDVDDAGRTIRFSNVAQSRDETARTQSTTLRYERIEGDNVERLERDFVLHWYTQDQFRALAADAGLVVTRRMPDDDTATAFVFWLAADPIG